MSIHLARVVPPLSLTLVFLGVAPISKTATQFGPDLPPAAIYASVNSLMELDNFGQTLTFDRHSVVKSVARPEAIGICPPPMFQCQTESVLYFMTPGEIEVDPRLSDLVFQIQRTSFELFGENLATHRIVVRRSGGEIAYSYFWGANRGIVAIAVHQPGPTNRYPTNFLFLTSERGPLSSSR